jgi:Fic family protein
MDTYHGKLREALGHEYQTGIDPTIWIEYFTDSVAKSLIELRPQLIEMRDAFVDAYNAGGKLGLSRDQVEALVFARIYGSVTTAEYIRATSLSRSTVVKRLDELLKKGILKVEGKGRSVRYIPIGAFSPQKTKQIQPGFQIE